MPVPGSRLALVLTCLVGVALAGCSNDAPAAEALPSPVKAYRFAYEGSDVHVPGTEHGWLIRLHNPSDEAWLATIVLEGVQDAVLGPVSRTLGSSPQTVLLPVHQEDGVQEAPPSIRLEPNGSGVFLAKVREYAAGAAQAGFRVLSAPAARDDAIVLSDAQLRPLTVLDAQTPVDPGDHIETVTVGVWTNGTSFYTNSASLLADPAFPAGFPRDAFDDAPLPVYVYDRTRDEQPAGSQDQCHFTTIAGYNALLKEQAEHSTGVRLMRPEDAYTVPGAEDHPLYGDPLVFLNTVVLHAGTTGPLDLVPDPTGACFADRLDGLPLPTFHASG